LRDQRLNSIVQPVHTSRPPAPSPPLRGFALPLLRLAESRRLALARRDREAGRAAAAGKAVAQ
jgi:hypothetical protein